MDKPIAKKKGLQKNTSDIFPLASLYFLLSTWLFSLIEPQRIKLKKRSL
jgi:hypothetical protein